MDLENLIKNRKINNPSRSHAYEVNANVLVDLEISFENNPNLEIFAAVDAALHKIKKITYVPSENQAKKFKKSVGKFKSIDKEPIENIFGCIQNYLDKTYGTYRLLVYAFKMGKVPLYLGPRQPTHTTYLPIYICNGSSYFVKQLNKLFTTSHGTYCPDCRSYVKIGIKHKKTCPFLCTKCGGYGFDYPCVGAENIECDQCYRKFPSQSCFDRHRTSPTCKIFKYCKDCSEEYMLSELIETHKCGVKPLFPAKNLINII